MSIVRRAVGYARISRERDESTSIARQREAIERKAAEQGWTLVDTIEDVDMSASKRRLARPGLTRVREMVARGEADVVIVWKLDRIARSVADVSTLLDEGLRLVATDQAFDTTTALGRAMVQIAQVFAEIEAATIGERTASMRAYLAQERKHAGPAPYGYRIVPHPSGSGKALAIHPEEAAHVRAAVDAVLDGAGAYGALKVLRERGSTPRRAAAWSISSVQVVLRGESILGRVRHKGAVLLDEEGRPETVWEPIVSIEEATAVRAALKVKPAGQRRRRATRLLSGFVECSGCGGRMRVSSTGTKGAAVFAYACRAPVDGRECAHPTSINAALLDVFIGDELLSVAGRLEIVKQQIVDSFAARRAEVEASLAHLGAQIGQPGADVATIAKKISDLQAEHASMDEDGALTVEEVRTGVTFGEAWEQDSAPEARRELLALALSGRIVVSPGQRGRRGIDPDRLFVPWRWNLDPAADALAGQID